MSLKAKAEEQVQIPTGGLGHRRLGVVAVAFMIVAASAPLTVIAGGSTSAFAVTHVAGIPLAYFLMGMLLAVFAIGYTAMSRHISNAGAFYAYAARGIGRPVGLGASVMAVVSYNAMQLGIYGMFGYQVSAEIESRLGFQTPWWLWVALCIAMVGWLGINRVDLSAKVLGVLVMLEFLVVIVFDISSFARPAEGVTVEPISPTALIVPGVGAAFAFSIAAYMGFEGAAIYSEEARDPDRTVPRATFLAVGVISVFYALSAWAQALAIGVEKISDPAGIAAEDAGPPLFFNHVAAHLGQLWVDIMSILFITSLFAALLSFHNAVARYAFSLGRGHLLPRWVGAVRSDNGAPWGGSLTQTLTAIVVICGFAVGERWWDPSLGPYPVLTLFTWMTNTGALGLVILMAVISAAVIGFFRRHPSNLGVGARIIAPVLSGAGLTGVAILIIVSFDVLLGQDEPTIMTYLLPAGVIIPAAAAVGYAYLLRAYRPAIYQMVGHGTDDLLPGPQLESEPSGTTHSSTD